MPEEKRHVVPMDDSRQKWNFGLIEILIAICIPLIGWNLKATINIKDGLSASNATQTAIILRVDHLENETNKGERFTAGDGALLRSEISHNREMQMDHIRRTEQKIENIHNVVVDRLAK